MKKKNLIGILLIFVLLISVGIVYLFVRPKTQEYVITQFMGNMDDAEEYVRNLKKNHDFNDARIVGKEIYVKATKEQCQEWVSNSITMFMKYMNAFEKNTGNKVSYPSDYSAVTFYIEAIDQKTWNELGDALTEAMYQSEMIQVFSGIPDWEINIQIIRPSDDKVLYQVIYPEEPLDVDSQIWESESALQSDMF